MTIYIGKTAYMGPILISTENSIGTLCPMIQTKHFVFSLS